MVDIHCHILPGVDDGAEDMAEALEMARMAVMSGVTDLAVTSHFRGNATGLERLELFYRQFCRLETAVQREQLPLRLHLGAEILCTRETVEVARSGLLPTMGDTSYVLCEFFFDAPYSYMDEILADIAEAGYRPVVAHPERYAAIQQEPRRAQRWFHKGYVIQVNKGSVLGAFGSRAQDTAQWLLEAGFVHILASDAHSAERRTTDFGRLKKWMLAHYPPAYAQLLLRENPGRLLRGRDMAPIR